MPMTQLSDINLEALLDAVFAGSTRRRSPLHGEGHWLRVGKMGYEIAKRSQGYDACILFLFCLLHDTQRQSEGRDPDHGLRAAQFAERLQGTAFTLSNAQLETLIYALTYHNKGKKSDDITIGLCWDADRLNLWRVGIKPSAKYLSTEPAKTRKMIMLGMRVQIQKFTWETLYQMYVGL